MGRVAFWAVLAFVMDQASKVIVVHWLNLKEIFVIEVLPPFLVFRMGWNDGINFGLLGGMPDVTRWLLTALAVIVSVALVFWSRKFTRPLALVATGLVIGGALANALDRVIYGAVADFLNMSCCGIVNPFAFNLADVFIFAGAFGLILFADDKSPRDPADGVG